MQILFVSFILKYLKFATFSKEANKLLNLYQTVMNSE